MPRLPRPDEIVNLKLSKHTNKNRKIVAGTLFEIDKLANITGVMPDLSGTLTEDQIISTDESREKLAHLVNDIGSKIKNYREFQSYRYLPATRELHVGTLKLTFGNGSQNTHNLLNSLNNVKNRSDNISYRKYLRLNKKKYFSYNTSDRAVMSARKYIKSILLKNGMNDFFANNTGLVVNKKYR